MRAGRNDDLSIEEGGKGGGRRIVLRKIMLFWLTALTRSACDLSNGDC